jgi:hypothetical protein
MKIFSSVWKILGLCVFSVGANAAENCGESTPPSKDPLPEHISVSHTEGKGLGYSRGYSSLDLFLSQPFYNKTMVPFLDLRGHIFNDGKWAANGGLGFRYLSDCYKQVWGANVFYDYLQVSHGPYNQVGGGIEALGENWDVHINGYFPVGHKKKNIYRFTYESYGVVSGGSDLGLEDLDLPGFRLKAREQFALKGIDSLVSYRFCRRPYLDLHIGAGPYFYWGSSTKTTNAFDKTHKHAFGGQIRAGISFMNYVIIEGITTYDNLFRWTGQGTLILNLPFDFTFKQKKSRSNSQCCESSYCLKERLYQPVERNEIIVVDSLNRFSTNPQILDPEFEP